MLINKIFFLQEIPITDEQMKDVPIDISDDLANRSEREIAHISVEILSSTPNQLREISSAGEIRRHLMKSTINSCVNKEEFTSYQRAKAFSSNKPFFISFMHGSYVSDPFTLVYN